MKYTLIILSIITVIAVAFVYARPVFAETAPTCGILPDSLCKASTTSDQNDVSKSGVFMLVIWVVRIMTGAVGVVAVGALTYAGITYSSAGGSSEQVTRAKRIITDTTIGLVAYGMMFFILNWLIPGGVFS